MAERRRAATELRENERESERVTDVRRRRVVLIVDDFEDNREMYASYFEAMGYRVVQASDGEAALDVITRAPPDVVVMDLSMPRLDGWEATRLIKSNPRTSKIIVVVVTGFSTGNELARARAAGATEVCTKPCTPKELLEKIEVHLQRTTD